MCPPSRHRVATPHPADEKTNCDGAGRSTPGSRRYVGFPRRPLLPLEPDRQLRVVGRPTARFGLYHVDYETQTRTPKLSAAFFRACTEANAVA